MITLSLSVSYAHFYSFSSFALFQPRPLRVFPEEDFHMSLYIRWAFISNSVEQHCQPVAGWDKRGQISLWLALGTWDKHACDWSEQ